MNETMTSSEYIQALHPSKVGLMSAFIHHIRYKMHGVSQERSVPRGIVLYGDEPWIVAYKGCRWTFEIQIQSVVAWRKKGSNKQYQYVKWLNYLRQIEKWPWTQQMTDELRGVSCGL